MGREFTRDARGAAGGEGIRSAGRFGANPVRLVLAGVAFSAAAGGIMSTLILLNPKTFDTFRFWDVGSLSRRDAPILATAIVILIGLVIVLAISRMLADIALGDDIAASLGTDVRLTRTLSLIAITMLCASATVIAGPVSFIGLMVPLIACWLMGVSRTWITVMCAALGPVIVLGADVVGRIAARPSELPVGILTAFVGSPVLLVMVAMMRKSRS